MVDARMMAVSARFCMRYVYKAVDIALTLDVLRLRAATGATGSSLHPAQLGRRIGCRSFQAPPDAFDILEQVVLVFWIARFNSIIRGLSEVALVLSRLRWFQVVELRDQQQQGIIR